MAGINTTQKGSWVHWWTSQDGHPYASNCLRQGDVVHTDIPYTIAHTLGLHLEEDLTFTFPTTCHTITIFSQSLAILTAQFSLSFGSLRASSPGRSGGEAGKGRSQSARRACLQAIRVSGGSFHCSNSDEFCDTAPLSKPFGMFETMRSLSYNKLAVEWWIIGSPVEFPEISNRVATLNDCSLNFPSA